MSLWSWNQPLDERDHSVEGDYISEGSPQPLFESVTCGQREALHVDTSPAPRADYDMCYEYDPDNKSTGTLCPAAKTEQPNSNMWTPQSPEIGLQDLDPFLEQQSGTIIRSLDGASFQETLRSVDIVNNDESKKNPDDDEDQDLEKSLRIEDIKRFLKTAENEVAQVHPREQPPVLDQLQRYCRDQLVPSGSFPCVRVDHPIQATNQGPPGLSYAQSELSVRPDPAKVKHEDLDDSLESPIPNQQVSDIIEHRGPGTAPDTEFCTSLALADCEQQVNPEDNNVHMTPGFPLAARPVKVTTEDAFIRNIDAQLLPKITDHQLPSGLNPEPTSIKIEQPDGTEPTPDSPPQSDLIQKRQRKRKGGLGEEEIQMEIQQKRKKDSKMNELALRLSKQTTDRKQRRMKQNRDAATRCREKKKRHVDELKKEEAYYEKYNRELTEEIENLRKLVADLSALKAQQQNADVPMSFEEEALIRALHDMPRGGPLT